MKKLLAQLLGIDDPAKIADVEWSKLSIRFLGLPQSWWALLTIGVIIVLIWFAFRTYKREGTSASPRLKKFLACLRFGAILLVLMGLFQPALIIDQSRPLRSSVLVLVDNSSSMGIKDKMADTQAAERIANALGVPASRLQQMSRMDIVHGLLGRNRSEVLQELSQIYDVRLIAFSDTLQEVALGGASKPTTGAAQNPSAPMPLLSSLASLQATGQSTNLELALRGVLTQTRGQPIAAVIVLTDGQANAGDALAAAKSFAQKGIQTYTVGIGDPSPPKNAEIGNVIAPNVVFKDDDLVVRATLHTLGFAGKPLRVSLKEFAQSADAGREVASQEITAPEDGKPLELALKFKPDALGVMTYRVEIPVQPGETIEADNVASTVVRVVDQKAQVLLVSGSPGKEYRYVKNFLIRDQTVQAQCWLQNADLTFNQETSPGAKALEKLPQTEEELFKYDVIILLDPDPSLFTSAWADLLKRFVSEHGGGLVYIAGNVYTEDFFANRQLASLANLLPVEVGRQGMTIEERLTRASETAWPLQLTPQGWDNPMFKLDNDDEANKKLWAEMPGIFWSQAVFASKPGGVPLAVHSDPRRRNKEGQQPLISMQFYGVGRTLYLGFNSTWRWRYIEQGKYFNQFWGQTLRYLSQGRLLGGRKRVLVFTDKDTYSVGQQVEVTVRMLESDYEHPMMKTEVAVEVKTDDNATSEIKLTPDLSKDGDYKGAFVALKSGRLEITPKVFDPSLVEKMANKNVQVTLPRLEFKETRMNEALLKQVAELTRGRYVPPHEFDSLRRTLPDKQVMLVNEATEDLWDAPIVLVLFCLLLFTEWIIRKMKNMA